MDIQVNRDQLERVVIKWLNLYYGNLTQKKHKHNPNLVLYINSDNKFVMEYDKETDSVYIHYRYVWSKIESIFHLKYDDVKSIMKIWLEETYKLSGVTIDYA